MNYEAAYLAKLEGLITSMGGVVPVMTTPSNFELRSLELLDAIAAAPGGAIDYRQTNEPSNPGVGKVWREIAANGLAIGDWQWDGLYWSGLQRHMVVIFSLSPQVSSSTSLYPCPFPPPFRLLGYVFNCAVSDAPQSATDYWLVQGLAQTTIFDTRDFPSIAIDPESSLTVMLATPQVKLLTDKLNNTSLARIVRVGAAGLIRRPALIGIFQRLRA